MILRKLTSLLDFDIDKASLAAAKRVAGDVKTGLAAASAGALALGAGLAWAIKKTVEAGGEAADTAQRLGLTAEAVQEFGYVAKLAGVEATEFAAGIARLAKKGGFASTEQALDTLAERFSKMPDGIKKTALAQEYFGRSGAQLIPFLNEGVDGLTRLRQEARDLGIVISDDAAQGMEAFGDDLDRLKMAGDGLVYTLGGALVPELQSLATELLGWVKQNRTLIQQKVTEWARRLVVGLRDLVRWARDLYERVKPIIEKMGGWESAIRKLIVAIVAFKALGFAANLLQITIALGRAAKAMKLLNATTLVNPYVLLAVALLGVGLALEDIQKYAKGGDSLLGSLLDDWASDQRKVSLLEFTLAKTLDDLGLLSKKHRVSFFFDQPQDSWLTWASDAGAAFATAATDARIFWAEAAADTGRRVRSIAVEIGSNISGAITTAWTAVVDFVERSLALIRDKAIEIGRSVSGAVTDVGTAISEAITTAWTAVVAFVERSLALIRDKAIEIGRSVSGAVTGGARSILPTWIADRVLPNTATPGASNQTLTLTAGPVTVNANTGASPEEIGRAVQQAQQDGILPLLRSAMRNLAPAEE